MIPGLAVPDSEDTELFLEDSGGSAATLIVPREEVVMVVLRAADIKSVHAWTASWLADRYGSESTEDPGDLPRAWR